MDQKKLKVGIFEDNKQLLSNIALYLSNHPDFELAFAEDRLTFNKDKLNELFVDYILLDEHMGNSSGIRNIEVIKGCYPNAEIILMTGDKDPLLPFQALENEISGLIYKPFFMEDICDTIVNHYRSGSSMPPMAITSLIKVLRRNKNSNVPIYNQLTKKEKQIITMIKTGMSYKQIAGEMKVTYNTVNFHVKNIFSKFGVNSIGQLMSKLVHH